MAANIYVCITLGVTVCALICTLAGITSRRGLKAVTLPSVYSFSAIAAAIVFGIAAMICCANNIPVAAILLSVPVILADIVLYIYSFYRVYYSKTELNIYYFIKKHTFSLSAVSDVKLKGKNTVISIGRNKYTLLFLLENIANLREICEKSINDQEKLDESDMDDVSAKTEELHNTNELYEEFDDFDDDVAASNAFDFRQAYSRTVKPEPEIKPEKQTTETEQIKIAPPKPIIGVYTALSLAVLAIATAFTLFSFLLPVYSTQSFTQSVITINDIQVSKNNIIITAEESERNIFIRNYSKTMADHAGFLELPAGSSVNITVTQDRMPLDQLDSDIEIFAVKRVDGRIYMSPQIALEASVARTLTTRYIAVFLVILSTALFIYVYICDKKRQATNERSTLTTR